ncbi:MAG: pyridoxal-5'-phosphate-dependent protein, partial [Puniceicoccales bacterium]|nr:pyridoxal-5'-phosphate-dependent protein [Puniceicoccales bacterium]
NRLAGQNVLTILSGANIDFGMLSYITRNSHIGGGMRRSLRIRIAERPGALLDVLASAFAGANIIEFQYGKTDPDEAWFTLGIASDERAARDITEKLDAQNIPWENVTGQEDVSFRVIRYNSALLKHPVFLNLDFYERPGALYDFLRQYVSHSGNICYFNYSYTGERIGRALLGIEFAEAEARARFLSALPSRGAGFRSCRAIGAPVEARLSGTDRSDLN